MGTVYNILPCILYTTVKCTRPTPNHHRGEGHPIHPRHQHIHAYIHAYMRPHIHTYITLQYITLHYITLHYSTLHYIHTCRYTLIHTCRHACIQVQIRTYKRGRGIRNNPTGSTRGVPLDPLGGRPWPQGGAGPWPQGGGEAWLIHIYIYVYNYM